MEEHELYHHGILGQKWGVRRFQNKDGSLTADGKKRYAENDSDDYEARKQQALKSGNASEVLKYKGDLTNKELQDAFTRINLEKQLSQISKEEVQTGFSKAMSVMDKVGKITNAADTAVKAYNLLAKINNTFSDKELPTIGVKKNKKENEDENKDENKNEKKK